MSLYEILNNFDTILEILVNFLFCKSNIRWMIWISSHVIEWRGVKILKQTLFISIDKITVMGKAWIGIAEGVHNVIHDVSILLHMILDLSASELIEFLYVDSFQLSLCEDIDVVLQDRSEIAARHARSRNFPCNWGVSARYSTQFGNDNDHDCIREGPKASLQYKE